MDQLFLFLLSSFGLQFLLCQSSLLEAPRRHVKNKSQFLDKLISCSFCSGFWCGLALFFVIFNTLPLHFSLVYGLAASAFCYLLDTVLLYLERH